MPRGCAWGIPRRIGFKGAPDATDGHLLKLDRIAGVEYFFHGRLLGGLVG
jgi:hypothetical protein